MRPPAVPPDRAAAGGDPALDLDEVLQRDRDAVQRPDGVAGADGLVGGLGGQTGLRGVDLDEGVELRVKRLDAGEIRFDHLYRREPSRGDVGRELVDGLEDEIAGHDTLTETSQAEVGLAIMGWPCNSAAGPSSTSRPFSRT